MAKQLQLRKGTATEHNTFTGADGEVTVDTTNKTLRVHDGSTVGGIQLATVTGGLVPSAQLPAATTSTQGAVILNNTLTSASTTQALTAQQGKVLNDQAFGIGQTWQNLTSSRALGVTYTNSTGKPIQVSVCVSHAERVVSTLSVSGVVVSRVRQDVNAATGYQDSTHTTIIPNGATYSASGGTLIFWSELR